MPTMLEWFFLFFIAAMSLKCDEKTTSETKRDWKTTWIFYKGIMEDC